MVWSDLVAGLLIGLSVAAYLVMLAGMCVATWRRKETWARVVPGEGPLVTILKPLAGADDELDDNLDSFAALHYLRYEIVFGVASIDDAAYPAARRFLLRHPRTAARIVVTSPEAINPKVAQLIGMAREARGTVLVISDSNVRVGHDYLDRLVTELSLPGVGLVSNAVAGTGEETIGAALENLQLGASIAPLIMAGSNLFGQAITVGKSMAFRRVDLDALGGFKRVGDVLAEDWALGEHFRAAGHQVRVLPHPVENRNVRCTVRRTFERHARWAKMRRSAVPAAFMAEPLTMPIATGSLVFALGPSTWTAGALVACVCVQTLGAMLCLRLLRGSSLRLRLFPLETVRTYVVLGCWLAAWLSLRVSWRGNGFELGRGSVIRPVRPGLLARRRAARSAAS